MYIFDLEGSIISLVAPVVISFALCIFLCPLIIPLLQKFKFGQFVRDDGPESHLKKAGTPTMGGIIFLASILVCGLLTALWSKGSLPVLILTIGFGIIGFVDDFIKIKKKRSLGLTAIQKLLLQFLVTAGFLLYYFCISKQDTGLLIPFAGNIYFNMPLWLFIPFAFFVVLGTVNGVNLTDGMDGVATGVTLAVTGFFLLAAHFVNPEMVPIGAVVFGSLLGFLVFNAHPAKVFMGDTGSLALGGFVSAMALMLHMPIYIIIVGFIYLAEALSVILQVTYFKATHGKRIFRMAPLHHHFEECGYEETQITTAFIVVTIVLCVLAFGAFAI